MPTTATRGRGRGGRTRDTTTASPGSNNNAAATPRRPNVIQFTIVYDKVVARQTFPWKATVRHLEEYVESEFGIPSKHLVIYGEDWPLMEANSSWKSFEELNLPSYVHIFVAVDGSVEEESTSSTTAGGSGESSSRQPSAEDLKRSKELQLSVYDGENDENYELLPFDGWKTVGDVKRKFCELTNISLGLQVWSGWPDYATDDMMLMDCGLDVPVHSLVLMKDSADSNASNVVDPETTHVSAGSKKATASKGKAAKSQKKPGHSRSSAQPLQKIIKLEELNIEDTIQPTVVASYSNSNIKDESIVLPDDAESPADAFGEDAGEVLYEEEDEETAYNLEAASLTPTTMPEEISVPEAGYTGCTPNGKRFFESDEEPSTSKKARTLIQNGQFPTSQRQPDFFSATSSPESNRRRKHSGPSEFLSLPTKVLQRLLRYLDPLTILSLRRVCKTTQNWISGGAFSRLDEEKWKKFRLVVTNEDHQTFETAVRLSLPITRYVFSIKTEHFYIANFDIFIAHCGLKVKELTLEKFFMFQNPYELAMLKSFHNLEKLTLNDLVVSDTPTVAHVKCPSTLQNLQVLKINYDITPPQDNVLIRPKSWDLTWGMLADCKSLLYFRFPRIAEKRNNPIASAEGIFAPLMDYIQMRETMGGVALEYLDMKNYDNPQSYYVNRYVDLLRKCHSKDIKLKNINSLVVQEVFDEDDRISDNKLKFCENVISLIHYCPFVQNAPLQNLEKISLDVIPSATDFNTLGTVYKDIFWAKLRTIKIRDSSQSKPMPDVLKCWQTVQEDLYGLNASPLDRGSVRYIRIDCPKFPYFLSEGRLAKKFYNLTRLEIISWYSDDKEEVLNKRLIPLWKTLRLEILRIENCPKLNDKSFIGENLESPAFLRLVPTLKQMTLGLSSTKVTDESFERVFAHLHLKTFVLLSSKKLEISEKALLTMQKGEFGTHIESFPFDGWSSKRIDSKRFLRLGKRFRTLR